MIRIGLLAGFIAALVGIYVANGVGDAPRGDDGFGPPSVGNCPSGRNCGMTLVVDNTTIWEAVEAP